MNWQCFFSDLLWSSLTSWSPNVLLFDIIFSCPHESLFIERMTIIGHILFGFYLIVSIWPTVTSRHVQPFFFLTYTTVLYFLLAIFPRMISRLWLLFFVVNSFANFYCQPWIFSSKDLHLSIAFFSYTTYAVCLVHKLSGMMSGAMQLTVMVTRSVCGWLRTVRKVLQFVNGVPRNRLL